ncbi:MAG: TRAP transporter substrate-binding protein [Pararhodobacter sp.]|nr:TRAP transporter substrate-binding protein [Pararhodobacter sp.]
MKRKLVDNLVSKPALAAGVVFATAALSGGFAHAQETVRWQVPIGLPSNLPAVGTPVRHLTETVSGLSGGNITLRYYEPGELIPAFEVLDAVSEGRYSAGYTWIGYDAGSVPSLNLLGGGAPFGLEPPGFLAWHYFGEGDALLQETYEPYGVRAILCGIVGPESGGWFNQQIDSVEKLQGLRMRFAGVGGEVMRRLGVSVTVLPGGELYQALERGTIDAVEFSSPAADRVLAFHEIVEHYHLPGWHQSATMLHLLVNQDAWDGLSEQAQFQIETGCKAATLTSYAESEYGNVHALQFWQDQGIQMHEFPQEVLERLHEVSGEVLEEIAGQDPLFARILQSQQDWMGIYGVWHERGHLPRSFYNTQSD